MTGIEFLVSKGVVKIGEDYTITTVNGEQINLSDLLEEFSSQETDPWDRVYASNQEGEWNRLEEERKEFCRYAEIGFHKLAMESSLELSDVHKTLKISRKNKDRVRNHIMP